MLLQQRLPLWIGLTSGSPVTHLLAPANTFAWTVAANVDAAAKFSTLSQILVTKHSRPAPIPLTRMDLALHAMLTGANLRAAFWPYAFYHYLRLYNFVPHGSCTSSPHELCGGKLPDLSKLRTFGCRVHVRPTTSRYGRVVPNSRLAVFLGYSRTLKVLFYFDLASSLVKTATHACFDEGMNDLVWTPPPTYNLFAFYRPAVSSLPTVPPCPISISR